MKSRKRQNFNIWSVGVNSPSIGKNNTNMRAIFRNRRPRKHRTRWSQQAMDGLGQLYLSHSGLISTALRTCANLADVVHAFALLFSVSRTAWSLHPIRRSEIVGVEGYYGLRSQDVALAVRKFRTVWRGQHELYEWA